MNGEDGDDAGIDGEGGGQSDYENGENREYDNFGRGGGMFSIFESRI